MWQLTNPLQACVVDHGLGPLRLTSDAVRQQPDQNKFIIFMLC